MLIGNVSQHFVLDLSHIKEPFFLVQHLKKYTTQVFALEKLYSVYLLVSKRAAPNSVETQMIGRFVPKGWPQSTKQNGHVLSPVGGYAMLQKMHLHTT
jgi:hypothetical protein